MEVHVSAGLSGMQREQHLPGVNVPEAPAGHGRSGNEHRTHGFERFVEPVRLIADTSKQAGHQCSTLLPRPLARIREPSRRAQPVLMVKEQLARQTDGEIRRGLP